jgi:hypothetical protein
MLQRAPVILAMITIQQQNYTSNAMRFMSSVRNPQRRYYHNVRLNKNREKHEKIRSRQISAQIPSRYLPNASQPPPQSVRTVQNIREKLKRSR